MAKKTYQITDGTSFYGITIRASVDELTNAFGEPSMEYNTGEDKVNFEWEMETEDGEVFTIYDWKEYRKLDLDQKVEWHIGAKGLLTSITAKEEILKAL